MVVAAAAAAVAVAATIAHASGVVVVMALEVWFEQFGEPQFVEWVGNQIAPEEWVVDALVVE